MTVNSMTCILTYNNSTGAAYEITFVHTYCEHMYHSAAISLQPEQFVYPVNEFNLSVTVCAQLAGNFEQNVIINVTTQPSQIPPIASKLFIL